MRVVLGLLLLCFVSGVLCQTPTATYTITANNAITAYTFGTLGDNPSFNVTVGNLYAFNITFVNTNHPFNFSGDNVIPATNPPTLTAYDPSFIVTAGTGCTASTGSPINGWIASTAGTPCTVWLNVTGGAAGKSIFYRCIYHGAMNGNVTAWAAVAPSNNSTNTTGGTTATPTTASPTTLSPTTVAPTSNGTGTTATPTTAAPTSTPAPTSGATLTVTQGQTLRIIAGNPATGYTFLVGGVQYINPTLTVTPGLSFSLSLEWSGTHPFGLSGTTNTGVQPTTAFFPSDYAKALSPISSNSSICDSTYPTSGAITTYSPTQPTNSPVVPCLLTVTVPTGGTGPNTIYYRCALHDKMIGALTIATPTQKPNTASTTAVGMGIVTIIASIVAIFA